MRRLWLAGVVLAGVVIAMIGDGPTAAQDLPLSPNGVKTLSPAGAIKPTGTWNLGTRAGDFVFVAGMRGIDPATNKLVEGDEARIRQGFLNMKLIAESEGASLRDAVRIVVYVTDMFRYRPLVNKVQEQMWGAGPYPPRTIVEVDRLNQDDVFEVEGTFYAPQRR
jgi:2-iminobutanoate/2-iminopropanoate deaminase